MRITLKKILKWLGSKDFRVKSFALYYGNSIIATEDYHKYMQNSINCKGCSQAEIKLNVKSDNTISIRKIKDSWNREEVIKLLNKFGEHVAFEFFGINYFMIGELNKWIKENL